VDDITRQTQRAMDLARRINMAERLARFDIDESTRKNLQLFLPTVHNHIDRVIIRFYEYLGRFPETRNILNGHNINRLREHQKLHWIQLLSADFGGGYVNGTLLIGLSHFNARVPPHVYIASYSFFMSEMLKLAATSTQGYSFQAISASINKVVMMDMSIVLNAYLLDSLTAEAARPKTVDI
jgi:hypothetical protein